MEELVKAVSALVGEEYQRAAAEHGGAAPVVPMKDSVKRIADGQVAADVPRESIAAVQTPQCFARSRIESALVRAIRRCLPLTDDCAAFEASGLPVAATEGDYRNIKITTPEDLLIAEALLKRWEE